MRNIGRKRVGKTFDADTVEPADVGKPERSDLASVESDKMIGHPRLRCFHCDVIIDPARGIDIRGEKKIPAGGDIVSHGLNVVEKVLVCPPFLRIGRHVGVDEGDEAVDARIHPFLREYRTENRINPPAQRFSKRRVFPQAVPEDV